jgi:predicted DNA-binding transcriptional regulator AlpA
MKKSLLPETVGYLRLSQIIGDSKKGIPPLLPVSKSTFWEGLKTGRYKLTPVKLSARCTAFKVEEVRAMLDQLASARGEL